MKKVITLIVVIFALNISAQSNYEKGMNKAFELWSANKSTEAGQLFERISKAEKELAKLQKQPEKQEEKQIESV